MSEQVNECNSKSNQILFDIIIKEIDEENGFISFDRFMELALYHSKLGYYTKKNKRVGKDGDFITSVSIGKCYGTILARYFESIIEDRFHKEKQIVIVEFGAENGDLALDVMTELKNILNKVLFKKIKYIVVEPFDSKRKELELRLHSNRAENYSIVPDLRKEKNLNGFVMGNEVLDAMPFRRVRMKNGKWVELGVGFKRSEDKSFLIEAERNVQCELLSEYVSKISNVAPEGFTTEVNVGLKGFLKNIYLSFSNLSGLFVDYGNNHDELIVSNRLDGTVRGYSGHRYIKNFLKSPGSHDITANVNFDYFQEIAEECGFDIGEPVDQYRFLTNAAKEWLLEIETSEIERIEKDKVINQFKMLIHPTIMGTSFKVLEFKK